MHGVDLASLILRVVLGVTMFAHGYRHIWGGGKLAGTAGWFESIGIRPGKGHALLASVTELGAAVLLFAGFLTPLGAAGVLGTMFVALIANHLRNAFFIFRPGEGYEYVLNLNCVALALGALGGGRISLDYAFGIDLNGWGGFLLTLCAGGGGAILLLATCWRPGRVPAKS